MSVGNTPAFEKYAIEGDGISFKLIHSQNARELFCFLLVFSGAVLLEVQKLKMGVTG